MQNCGFLLIVEGSEATRQVFETTGNQKEMPSPQCLRLAHSNIGTYHVAMKVQIRPRHTGDTVKPKAIQGREVPIHRQPKVIQQWWGVLEAADKELDEDLKLWTSCQHPLLRAVDIRKQLNTVWVASSHSRLFQSVYDRSKMLTKK